MLFNNFDTRPNGSLDAIRLLIFIAFIWEFVDKDKD
jgi:hypothetical protein